MQTELSRVYLFSETRISLISPEEGSYSFYSSILSSMNL